MGSKDPYTNNATRMLDAKGIPYQAMEIPNRKMNAQEVADFLNAPPDQVYKTIVTKKEKNGKFVLALVPTPTQVNLKKLAKALKEKKMVLPTQKEAEKATGLRAGGISPLILVNKGFQTIIDQQAEEMEEIIISAGQWGLQIQMNPIDLAKLTNARFVPIAT